MRSTELAETALSMRNVAFNADDFWTTFEVIENGELGMQDFPVKDSPPPTIRLMILIQITKASLKTLHFKQR